MRSKAKAVIWVVVILVFCISSFWIGSQFFRTDMVLKSGNLSLMTADTEKEVLFEKKVSDIAVADGMAAIVDDDGLSILDEKTGVDTEVTKEPASSVVFDGRKAFFVRRNIEDRTVIVERREFNESSGDMSFDENRDPVAWVRGRVCSYDVTTSTIEELFDTNGFNACVVYADEKYLYYTDYADENIGWFTGESQHVAPTLYRYDLLEKKRDIISKFASKIGTIGNLIVYNDSDIATFRHRTFFYGGGLHVYDTTNNMDHYISEDAELLYFEDQTLVYVQVPNYKGYGSESECMIMRCDVNGENKEEKQRINGILDHHFGQYLVFENNDVGGFEIYNTLTKESFVSNNWYYEIRDGELLTTKESAPGKIYTVTSNGAKSLLFDISDKLPDGYIVTSFFDEYGVFCESKEDFKYLFIPFE